MSTTIQHRLLARPTVEMNVSLVLTSEEVRALDALAGYNVDAFLKVFYAQMGRAYLEPHEAGLRSVFETIRAELPRLMNRHDAARKAFVLADPVIMSRVEFNERLQRERAAAKANVSA